MKITLDQQPGAEKEIILRFDTMDADVQAALDLLSLRDRRLAVTDAGAVRLMDPAQVLYCESVDDRTFVYTAAGVYGTGQSLSAVAEAFAGLGFFRCSKSMAVNLHAIRSFKSGDNGRVFATLENGERIVVSRRYATALRRKLKGESQS